MELPALKLAIVQGPRKGDTLEFRSGSTIRIGRVVRGNNVNIKDAGISSKHLLIGCDSGKWIVQDLDSSNGTTLNSSTLPPFTPFDLRDGDTVKLGEFTSIVVQFITGEEQSQLRRNPRRKAKEDNVGSVLKTLKIEVKSEVEPENVEKLQESAVIEEKPRRGRPRKGKVSVKVVETEKEQENVNIFAEKSGVTVEESENVGCVAEKPGAGSLNVRVTRNRKNNKCLISENFGGESGRPKRGGWGRRKNLQDSVPENVQFAVLPNQEKVALRGEKPEQAIDVDHKCGSMRNEENVEVDVLLNQEKEDLGLNLREEAQEQANEVDVSKHAEIRCRAMNGEEKKEGLDTETKCEDGGLEPVVKESNGRAQVNNGKILGIEEEIVDLEKITMGQWFDYMEVHFSKQIIEITEEMIEELRRKVAQFGEYIRAKET